MDTTNSKETKATKDGEGAIAINKKEPNMNEIWTSLDEIFRCRLRETVLDGNEEQFNAMAKELGFNNKQKEFLSESIKTYASFYYRHQTASPQSSSSVSTKRKKSLYHNSNSKNEPISGNKRRRTATSTYVSSFSDDDFSESDDDASIVPKRKRRKKQKNSDEDYENDIELREGEYEVEAILGHKKIAEGFYKYETKWLGYDETTWEPPINFSGDAKLLDDYWEGKGKHDEEGVMAHFTSRDDENKKEKSHKKKKRDKKKKRKKKKKDKEKKTHDCTFCGKSFRNGSALGGHCAAKHPKKNRTPKAIEYWVESDEDEEKELVIEE